MKPEIINLFYFFLLSILQSIAKSLSNDNNSRLSCTQDNNNNRKYWNQSDYNQGWSKSRDLSTDLARYKSEHLLDNVKRSQSYGQPHEDEMIRFQSSNWSVAASSTVPYPSRLNQHHQHHYFHKDMTRNHVTTNDPFYGRNSSTLCPNYSTSIGLREKRIKPGFTSNKQTFPIDKSTAAITEFETVL